MSPVDRVRKTRPVQHQRKPHKKSRSGCTNCRFRRVKCGEEKPSCQRCEGYMVPCRYDRGIEDLQTFSEEVTMDFMVSSSDQSSNAPSRSATLSPTSGPLMYMSYDSNHAIIHRFQQHTALTLADIDTGCAYAEFVPRLAMQYDYVLHAVLATTILHDRALIGDMRPSIDESYHISIAAASFNQKLSHQITDRDRDPLWAAAVYLCVMAVFSVNTSDPAKAWPLKHSSLDDLEWLNLQAGLRVVWSLAAPRREDGIFSRVEKGSKVNCVYPNDPQPGIDGIPSMLVDLCRLNHWSTGFNSPYHTAARHLSFLLQIPGTPGNLLTFMVFAGGMTQDFKALLHQKDPVALLLMGLWYSRLFYSAWWMAPRARVECQAICQHLGSVLPPNTTFSELLLVVKALCLAPKRTFSMVTTDRSWWSGLSTSPEDVSFLLAGI